MLDINDIKEKLAVQFPELSFSTTRRLTGRCIVAMKSKYQGADIFVKRNKIVIEAAIPQWKTRLMLGAGALYKKLTDKDFSKTALQIKDYLSKNYEVSLRV
jgi:hypothetical protein